MEAERSQIHAAAPVYRLPPKAPVQPQGVASGAAVQSECVRTTSHQLAHNKRCLPHLLLPPDMQHIAVLGHPGVNAHNGSSLPSRTAQGLSIVASPGTPTRGSFIRAPPQQHAYAHMVPPDATCGSCVSPVRAVSPMPSFVHVRQPQTPHGRWVPVREDNSSSFSSPQRTSSPAEVHNDRKTLSSLCPPSPGQLHMKPCGPSNSFTPVARQPSPFFVQVAAVAGTPRCSYTPPRTTPPFVFRGPVPNRASYAPPRPSSPSHSPTRVMPSPRSVSPRATPRVDCEASTPVVRDPTVGSTSPMPSSCSYVPPPLPPQPCFSSGNTPLEMGQAAPPQSPTTQSPMTSLCTGHTTPVVYRYCTSSTPPKAEEPDAHSQSVGSSTFDTVPDGVQLLPAAEFVEVLSEQNFGENTEEDQAIYASPLLPLVHPASADVPSFPRLTLDVECLPATRVELTTEPELAEPEFAEPELTEPELTEPELTEAELETVDTPLPLFEAMEPVLLHVWNEDHQKDGTQVHVARVPVRREELSEQDAFVLDAGDKIYVFAGSYCSAAERISAGWLANRREVAQGGVRAKATHEIDSQFWQLLGGSGPISKEQRQHNSPEESFSRELVLRHHAQRTLVHRSGSPGIQNCGAASALQKTICRRVRGERKNSDVAAERQKSFVAEDDIPSFSMQAMLDNAGTTSMSLSAADPESSVATGSELFCVGVLTSDCTIMSPSTPERRRSSLSSENTIGAADVIDEADLLQTTHWEAPTCKLEIPQKRWSTLSEQVKRNVRAAKGRGSKSGAGPLVLDIPVKDADTRTFEAKVPVAQPYDTAKPADTSKPIDCKPFETSKTLDSSKPFDNAKPSEPTRGQRRWANAAAHVMDKGAEGLRQSARLTKPSTGKRYSGVDKAESRKSVPRASDALKAADVASKDLDTSKIQDPTPKASAKGRLSGTRLSAGRLSAAKLTTTNRSSIKDTPATGRGRLAPVVRKLAGIRGA
mmetsp:Transcript_11269/g.31283  ORF Transcript_11269/g.31283 Transcript_11269/m.31283 type:complete len:983 (-) Transcript_11269:494-3442(-)